MRSRITSVVLVAGALLIAGASLRADVQTQQKTHVQFAGALGHVVNMFGGKAAKEGTVETIAVKGDRMMTVNDKTGELIDLAEEKVYKIDFDSKSYKVQTFAEIRQKMQEEQEKAKERMSSAQEKPEKTPTEPQKKMAVDVSTKETGQKKTINGFDCKEVVTTVTMHEDGKTLEESGGTVMTTDAWVTKPIPAMKEVAAFRRRYMEKLSGMDAAATAQQMAQAMAMYPQLKDLIGRSRVEGQKVDGTPISTLATIETVESPEQQKKKAGEEQQPDSTSGGIGGLLAKKMMHKKQDENAAGSSTNRSSLMTTTMEVLSVATDVAADAVSVPAGFKQKS